MPTGVQEAMKEWKKQVAQAEKAAVPDTPE